VSCRTPDRTRGRGTGSVRTTSTLSVKAEESGYLVCDGFESELILDKCCWVTVLPLKSTGLEELPHSAGETTQAAVTDMALSDIRHIHLEDVPFAMAITTVSLLGTRVGCHGEAAGSKDSCKEGK
jgi:hypothetical protein